MADKGIHAQAINIRSDVDDFFDSYDFETLGELEDVQDYITNLGDLKRAFRRIHSQITEIERAEFGTKYPDFDKLLDGLNYRFKIANQKLGDRKSFWKQIQKEKFEEGKLAEEKQTLLM